MVSKGITYRCNLAYNIVGGGGQNGQGVLGTFTKTSIYKERNTVRAFPHLHSPSYA